ncbi:MAG: hypothetical protein K5683_06740 [Prevotella sp.]|nr:hypothetical protein [Prevotella sp.]
MPAGAANPAPPVGPALGQKGVNIMEFCKQFNAKTQNDKGMIIPVVITVYADKSFTFITKVSQSRWQSAPLHPALLLLHWSCHHSVYRAGLSICSLYKGSLM